MSRTKRPRDGETVGVPAAPKVSPLKKKARMTGSPVRPGAAPEEKAIEPALSTPKRHIRDAQYDDTILPVAVKRDNWPGLAGFKTWVHLGDIFSIGADNQEKVWHDYLRDKFHAEGRAAAEVKNHATKIASVLSDLPVQADDYCGEQPPTREDTLDPETTLYVIWLGFFDSCYEEIEVEPVPVENHSENLSDDGTEEDKTDEGSKGQPDDECGGRIEDECGGRTEGECGGTEGECKDQANDEPGDSTLDELDNQTDEDSEHSTDDRPENPADLDHEPEDATGDEFEAAYRVTHNALIPRRVRERAAQRDPAQNPDLQDVVSILFDSVQCMSNKARARNFLIIDVPPADRAPRMMTQGCSDDARWFIQVWNEHLRAAAREFAKDYPDVSLFVVSSHKVFSDLLDDPEEWGFEDEDAMETNGKIWTTDRHVPVSVSDKVHQMLADKIALAVSLVEED
ncbi:uncharacterized protein B0H18DRAFT_1116638 [Fomitopsis serialis]|uniref:uncharacterized protein n=1 Tax=Fomitopsis serialis TaxID=139415 RepID=UPI002007C14A|nr:uncharacterized protein B0H18DRAFT_1116638 [Neoantrodia serialis]KAH9930932.1 hypothetical protein B0H18DRAFT_1116638 [Neoantrodia serialis]